MEKRGTTETETGAEEGIIECRNKTKRKRNKKVRK